jgi:hypothetical protein
VEYEKLARDILAEIQKELGMTTVTFAAALRAELESDGPHPVTVAQWRAGAVKNPGSSYLLAAAHLLSRRKGLTLDQIIRRVEGADSTLIEVVRSLEARIVALEQGGS